MSTPEVIAGRYRLVRRVGAGAMGVVWEAWDERLQRAVAIKQLHVQPGLSDEEAELAKNRAMREARITARLDHPNAVPVFDVVEQDGRPCLVMQFLPSTPLSGVLKERGTLPPVEAARIGAQVASALASAHAVGIVHRDVKPGNILMAANGTARISDFGISHALGDATLTSTGMVHGTPAYLAPEVALGGSSSFASDVFGLGATIYTMLEGAPPFGTDPNPIVLLHRVASGRFDPPANGAALTPLVLEMLATDAALRPSMGDVAQRLTAIATAQPVDPETVSPATLAFTREMQPTQHPWDQAPAADASDPTTRVTPAQPVAAAAVPPASPPPADATATSGAPPQAGSSRRLGRVLLVLAVLVIAGLATALLIPDLNRPGTATGDPSAQVSQPVEPAPGSAGPSSAGPSSPAPSSPASSASSSPTASPTPTPSPTRSSASPSPSPSPTRSSEVEGAATADQLEDAINSYYDLMPDDRDAAWSRLTRSYQNGRVGGRGSYDGFWEDVERVSVRKVSADPPDKAEATIRYTFEDGRVVTEQTSYGLVNDGGTLKINSSSVISSSTR